MIFRLFYKTKLVSILDNSKFIYVIYCYILKLTYFVGYFGLLVVERSRNDHEPEKIVETRHCLVSRHHIFRHNYRDVAMQGLYDCNIPNELCTDAINRVSTQQNDQQTRNTKETRQCLVSTIVFSIAIAQTL